MHKLQPFQEHNVDLMIAALERDTNDLVISILKAKVAYLEGRYEDCLKLSAEAKKLANGVSIVSINLDNTFNAVKT